MKRAEKIIRQQIDSLSMDRIATQKHELEQAIKWFHWQGTFRTKKFNQLNELLSNKYTEVMNKYQDDFEKRDNANYERFKKLHDIQY
jgi:hypothetical protein